MSFGFRKGFFVFALFFALAPAFAFAQYQLYGLPGVEKTALLSFSPDHPSPGDIIHFVVKSPVIDLSGATIAWYLNGKSVANGTGLTEADIPAGNLGDQMLVEVDVSNENVSAVATATIIPTEVDLLYDTSVYTPPFFQGRALPTSGSQLHLQALARFKKSDKTFVPTQNITFTWMKDGNRIPRGSGKGLDSIVVPSSIGGGAENITVTASADGGFEGGASVSVLPAKPILMLYEDSPIYGYLYNNALPEKSLATADEMTVAAVPFYALASSPNDPTLQYDWTVNETTVEATSSVRNEVTLGGKDGGLAQIQISVSDNIDYFFTLLGKWQILFSPGAIRSRAQSGGDLLPVSP